MWNFNARCFLELVYFQSHFSPITTDAIVDVDDFVFTTEAHLLPLSLARWVHEFLFLIKQLYIR